MHLWFLSGNTSVRFVFFCVSISNDRKPNNKIEGKLVKGCFFFVFNNIQRYYFRWCCFVSELGKLTYVMYIK